MPPAYSRRDALGLCGVAFAFGTGGCLGTSPNDTGSRETDAPNGTSSRSTAATDTRSTTPDRTTIAASVLSDEEAKERALAAEEKYLTERLQDATCLTDWGTYPTTMDEWATVTERTAEGVHVEVTHPYSYSTEDTTADGGSNALYVITAERFERVRGDAVTPC